MYHIVCPAKYRKAVISEKIDKKLKGICLEIEKRYEKKFLEIGTEQDHVHFLLQSVPGEFWTRGYYVGTAGEHGNEKTIARHVRNQGRKPEEYENIYECKQLELFS